MKKLLTVLFICLFAINVLVQLTYTNTTKTICDENKHCTLTLYSGIMYVEEDGSWIEMQKAKSLKGYFNKVYLEKDNAFEINIIDFNYNSIELETNFIGNPLDYPIYCTYKSLIEYKCQFKNIIKWEESNELGEPIEQTIKYDMKYEVKDGIIVANTNKYSYKGNPLGKTYTFGGNSTTIILDDNITEDLENVSIYYSTGGVPFTQNDERLLIKFKISDIPAGETIDEAKLYLFQVATSSDSLKKDANITRINNQVWTKDDAVGTLDALNLDYTKTDLNNSPALANAWQNWIVTNIVETEYNLGDANVSFHIHDNADGIFTPANTKHATELRVTKESGQFGTEPYLWYARKDDANVAARPYLEITYSKNFAIDVIILGDLNRYNIFKGGQDVNFLFSVHDSDNNASDFLVDFNLNIIPVVGQGSYVVFKDFNLAIDFNAFGGQDTNNLGLGFDVNFTYSFALPLLDANYYFCINLKDQRNDVNVGKCASVSIMIDSTKPSTGRAFLGG